MTTEFKREERYIVFKMSDVVEHLTTTEALHLARLYEIQRVGRKEAGKSELECVVVEKDWPEYEPTWQAIEARVTGAQAQPAPGIPEGWNLVPIEPTDEMVRIATAEYVQACSRRLHPNIAWRRAFQAMLAAAPDAKPCPNLSR